MAVGWSPLGSYSDTSVKATPPSDFSGRGGRCGMNCGRLPDTSGWAAIIGCSASTARARSERSCGLARMALSDAVMLSMLREGGPDLAQRGEGGRAGGQERRLRRLGEALGHGLGGRAARLRRAAGALYGRRGRLARLAARGARAGGAIAGALGGRGMGEIYGAGRGAGNPANSGQANQLTVPDRSTQQAHNLRLHRSISTVPPCRGSEFAHLQSLTRTH